MDLQLLDGIELEVDADADLSAPTPLEISRGNLAQLQQHQSSQDAEA
jgi:hypothetical protein